MPTAAAAPPPPPAGETGSPAPLSSPPSFPQGWGQPRLPPPPPFPPGIVAAAASAPQRRLSRLGREGKAPPGCDAMARRGERGPPAAALPRLWLS